MGQGSQVIREVFSTITSPVFSELVIVLLADVMSYQPTTGYFLCKGLRELNEVRPFKLAFSFEGHLWGGDIQGALAIRTASQTRTSDLDFLDSPPTVRIPRYRYEGWGLLDDD